MVVSVRVNGATVGSLNLYSLTDAPFDDISQETAALFAASAAVALGHSRRIVSLSNALASRTTIGTAIGIVMQHYGLNRNRAFTFLVRVSQTGNVMLRHVAQQIVDEADGNAEIEESSAPQLDRVLGKALRGSGAGSGPR